MNLTYQHLVPLSSVLILDRQRKTYTNIDKLADSIKRIGVLHPPTIRRADSRLVEGGRRCAAMALLGWTEIPVRYVEELTDAELADLELEENVQREDLTWQEEVLAVSDLHYKRVNEATKRGEVWGQRQTAEVQGVSLGNINNCLRLARELRLDKERKGVVWQADSATDAIRALMQQQENLAMAELVKRTTSAPSVSSDLGGLLALDDEEPLSIEQHPEYEEAKSRYLSNPLNDPLQVEEYVKTKLTPIKEEETVIHLSNMLLHVDCLVGMKDYEGVFDHIFTDPPYAIDMDNLDQAGTGSDMSSVRAEHEVGDNLILLDRFVKQAFSCLKDNGFFVMWCDQMQWQYLYTLATSIGFKVQRWPLTWNKTGPCSNQSAAFNFTKTTEIAMVCRKGNAVLAQHAASSVWTGTFDTIKDAMFKSHPFAKPGEMWEWVLDKISYPSQLILEPFAGRGSAVISFLRKGRRVIAMESNQDHFNHLINNTKNHYGTTLGKTTKLVFK